MDDVNPQMEHQGGIGQELKTMFLNELRQLLLDKSHNIGLPESNQLLLQALLFIYLSIQKFIPNIYQSQNEEPSDFNRAKNRHIFITLLHDIFEYKNKVAIVMQELDRCAISLIY